MVGNQTQGLSDEAIQAATGRNWQAWMTILDDWRIGNPSLADTTHYLVTRYHLRQFWGQTIAVYYSLVHCRNCGDWLNE